LTTDGENDAAAISPNGDLLLARSGGGGTTENIWLRGGDGTVRKVTNGQFDTAPDFSPDGSAWIYSDYPSRSIMICAAKGTACRVLRRDEILPAWPRFSPDASKVAYVRFGAAASQLVVFSIADGKERLLGSTHWQCPPVCASPNNVSTFEGSAGGYAWVEKDVETALRTGRRVQVTDNQNAVNDQ